MDGEKEGQKELIPKNIWRLEQIVSGTEKTFGDFLDVGQGFLTHQAALSPMVPPTHQKRTTVRTTWCVPTKTFVRTNKSLTCKRKKKII